MAKGDGGAPAGTAVREAPEAAAGPTPMQVIRDPVRLRAAQARRLNRKLRIKGELLFPCLPSLLEEFVQRLAAVFSVLGKPFAQPEIDQLRQLMRAQLEKGFAKSSLSQLKVWWWSDDSKDLLVHYRMQVLERSKSGQYEYWVKNRKPPLFGALPDARVMEVAASLPKGSRIADLGAGTGRNAIPLAAAGHRVDALDATQSFVEIIKKDAAEKGVAERIGVVQGDILTDEESLAGGVYQLVLLAEVVPDLRRLADLRRVFWRANHLLAPRGILLFNAFVADDDYEMDQLTRELSQVHWSWLLTRRELAQAASGLPFELESDIEAHDYERARQAQWPPTGWYSQWARGKDLFALADHELPPVSLRWLTFRKSV
ncbi:MAG TPA: class I SAM-dependent methyltransferase [Kiloniellales bacterium]|nr:class I SAM-dependent methyltransferase [Kiloniellales bacterium]